MAIKTISVPIGGKNGGGAALSVAADLAKRFGAHVEGLCPVDRPIDMLPYMTEAMPSTALEAIVETAKKTIKADAVAQKKRFLEFCGESGLALADAPKRGGGATASWRQEQGRAESVVARRGRLFDLIVLERPNDDWPTPQILEAALLETGRPLLVVPPGKTKTIGTAVAIGWNGSAEAASAITAAGPFLGQAKSVAVLSTAGGAPKDIGPKELVAHLAWHGIKATAKTFSGGAFSTGKALLAAAATTKADLLVMGGYGHSRGRELVFGGATRHVLEAANIPILMLH